MSSQDDRPPVRWTERERDVLNLLADGKTNSEIAVELEIAFATAKWHVSEILSKLGVESREDAARYWRSERKLLGRARRASQWILGGIVLKATASGIVLAAAGLAIASVVMFTRSGSQNSAGGSTASTPSVQVDEWTPLRRPMRLPAVSPEQPCPVSSVLPHTPFLGAGAGNGPFFVTLASVSRRPGVMDYGLGNAYGGDWGGQKTLWYVDPGQYRGRAIVRGHRLDGPGELKFDYVDGHPLADELDLDAGKPVVPGVNGDWPNWVGTTRIRLDSPGCYAFQVDGTDFTEVIVFEALHALP